MTDDTDDRFCCFCKFDDGRELDDEPCLSCKWVHDDSGNFVDNFEPAVHDYGNDGSGVLVPPEVPVVPDAHGDQIPSLMASVPDGCDILELDDYYDFCFVMSLEQYDAEPMDEEDVSESQVPVVRDVRKDLLHEMRGLLNNYPQKLEVKSNNSYAGMAHNLLLIHDILIFCINKSQKPDMRILMEAELSDLKSVGVESVRRLYLSFNDDGITHVGRSLVLSRMMDALDGHFEFVVEKTQYFILAMPAVDKKPLNFKTLDGFAADKAQDYEEAEIKKGEGVGPDTAFKIEDGQVVVVN